MLNEVNLTCGSYVTSLVNLFFVPLIPQNAIQVSCLGRSFTLGVYSYLIYFTAVLGNSRNSSGMCLLGPNLYPDMVNQY